MNSIITVLGTPYSIEYRKECDDKRLESVDGYMDRTIKKIVVCEFVEKPDSVVDLEYHRKEVLRHEIVHAFLNESGLGNSTLSSSSWAYNEEMIDWIAKQHCKMHKAFEEAGAL